MKNYNGYIADLAFDAERNCYWFFDGISNCICKYDVKENKVRYIKRVDLSGSVFKQHKLYYVSGKLYIVGFGSPKVMVVDIDGLFLEKYEYVYDVSESFWNSFLYDGFIYLIPRDLSKKFYIFSLADNCISEIVFDNALTEETLVKGNVVQLDNIIWMVEAEMNYCYKIDLLKSDISRIAVKTDRQLYGICKANGHFYFTSSNNESIIECDSDFKIIRIIGDDVALEQPYSNIVLFHNKIIATPRFADFFLIYDLANGDWSKVHFDVGSKTIDRANASMTYGYFERDRNTLIFLPWGVQTIIGLNVSRNIFFSEAISTSGYFNLIEKEDIIREKVGCSLSDMVRALRDDL